MDYQKNQLIEVIIEDVGTEGEGIGKIDGFPFFVKDAVVGDRITAKVMKAKKNYAYARLEEILEPSPARVEPKCPCSRACGGCQIQAMSYEKQLEFKANKVRNNLKRIGGFSEEELDQVMQPILGMEEPWHYRAKAQYPIGYNKEGRMVAGFYAGRTHSIIANTDCYLGAEEYDSILKAILKTAEENKVKAYEEETGKGLLRHVLLRKSRAKGDIMVCLIINGKKLPAEEAFVKALSKMPGITSISINVNTEKTNVIMGKETRCIWGEATIEDTLRLWENGKLTGEEVHYRISPNSFFQVNPVQTEQLYSLALQYAGLTGKEIVWDLYCGLGSISLFLAQRAKKVYGVEIIPQAIEDAKENAKANQLDNTEFYVGKAEEVLPDWYGKHKEEQIDVIVVDPPRKGCDEACLNTMLEMQPKKIVYVSCDSATLSRDLKILCQGGYDLLAVTPVDMFPHTVHVECAVELIRKK